MQLEIQWNDEPCECPACGEDWPDTFCGLDVRRGVGEAYVTWTPCCEAIRTEVEAFGWANAYGYPLAAVVESIVGEPVLDVVEEGDGTVVCRLAVDDPTTIVARGKAAAPAGWFRSVCAEVEMHHAHHGASRGHKFSVAVRNGSTRVGVAVVGRPVARRIQEAQPRTLEVTRVCVWGHGALRRNAASKLYAAAASRAAELGADRLITYTLDSESGASLRAAGWVPTARSGGGSWSRSARPREDAAPTCPKVRWERGLTKRARREVAAAALEGATV